MATRITYRYLATEQDFSKLRLLYEKVFSREVSEVELRWRFTQNPMLSGFYYNYAALDSEDTIAGHTAYIPMQFVANSAVLKGALSVGSAVSSASPGLFPKLHSDLEEKMVVDGFDFLFAFANENSFPFFVKYFGFKEHVYDYLKLDVGNVQPVDVRVSVQEPVRGIANLLSNKFLRWRLFNSPLHTYRIYEDGNIQLMYKEYAVDEVDVICIRFKEGDFKLTSLCDFLSTLERTERINLYSTSREFTNILMMLGFVSYPVSNRLVYKILAPGVNEENFFLQMIDSDLF